MGTSETVEVGNTGSLECLLDKQIIVGRKDLDSVLAVRAGDPGNEFSVRIGLVRQTRSDLAADLFTDPLAQ